MATIFFTGGTGFLGSYLACRLLQQGHKLVFLVRRAQNKNGQERIGQAISGACRNLFLSDDLRNGRGSYTSLEGDIALANLGLDDGQVQNLAGKIDEIWHCAASLSFKEEDRKKNFTVNVGGTENCIAFAKRVGARRFIHLGTAYVQHEAGQTAYEDELIAPQKFYNPYEETKFAAEKAVRTAVFDSKMDAIIFRPSILLGDRNWIQPSGFGYYAFLLSLARMETGMPRFPILFPYLREATVNLIPIHRAVSWMLEIADKKPAYSKAGSVAAFHIVNPNPPALKTVLDVTLPHFKIGVYPFSAPKSAVRFFFGGLKMIQFLNPALRRFAKTVHYYGDYLLGESVYDMTNTKTVLGDAAALDGEELITPRIFEEAIAGFRASYHL